MADVAVTPSVLHSGASLLGALVVFYGPDLGPWIAVFILDVFVTPEVITPASGSLSILRYNQADLIPSIGPSRLEEIRNNLANFFVDSSIDEAGKNGLRSTNNSGRILQLG